MILPDESATQRIYDDPGRMLEDIIGAERTRQFLLHVMTALENYRSFDGYVSLSFRFGKASAVDTHIRGGEVKEHPQIGYKTGE